MRREYLMMMTCRPWYEIGAILSSSECEREFKAIYFGTNYIRIILIFIFVSLWPSINHYVFFRTALLLEARFCLSFS